MVKRVYTTLLILLVVCSSFSTVVASPFGDLSDSITGGVLNGLSGLGDSIADSAEQKLLDMIVNESGLRDASALSQSDLQSPETGGIIGAYFFLLTTNPKMGLLQDTNDKSMKHIRELYDTVMELLAGIYILALVALSGYMMTSGGNPAKRLKSKDMAFRLLLIGIFSMLAWDLYGAIIEFQTTVTILLINVIAVDLSPLTSAFTGGLLFVGPMFVLFQIIGMLFILRLLIVTAGVVFLPIASFLWAIPQTERIGGAIARVLIGFIFIPIPEALILFVANAAMGLYENALIQGLMLLGFLLTEILVFIFVLIFSLKSSIAYAAGHTPQGMAIETILNIAQKNTEKK